MSKVNKQIPSRVICTLTITAEELTDAIKKETHNAIKTVTVKGFRKGKAPQHLAQSAVDPEKVEQRALSVIVPQKLEAELLKEKETSGRSRIIVVTEPRYEMKEHGWHDGKDTIIEAIVDLYPEVYTGHIIDELSLKKAEPETVTEEKVTEFIAKLRENVAKMREGKQDTPTEVSDEELLKAIGVNTIEELKEKVKAELELDAKYLVEQQFENQLIEALVNAVEIDIPEPLIQREVSRIVESVQNQLNKIGATLDNYLESQGKTEDQWRTEVVTQARNNVASMLVLTELSQDLEIALTPEEENEVNSMNTAEQRDTMRLLTRQRKAIEIMKEKVQSR